jgi:hypothetical protein
MEFLCEFINECADVNQNEMISEQYFSYDEFANIDNCINIISLLLNINKEDIEIYKDNIDIQRKTVISVNYKGRVCEFYEHFDSQRDYIGVRLMPV